MDRAMHRRNTWPREAAAGKIGVDPALGLPLAVTTLYLVVAVAAAGAVARRSEVA